MGRCVRALLATALAVPGCAPEERATLVPLRACGIEGELAGLRLTARGDFSPAAAPPVQFSAGTRELRDLPGNVTGITVEGLFGPSVAAVGRTARLQTEGLLPVYFSAPDRVCPVESELPAREVGAMAVGERGDVLLVGGVAGTELTADILHYRDVEGEMELGLEILPWASTGQTLHPFGERRFISVGGVSVGDVVLPRAVTIEVGDTGADVAVGTPLDLEAAGAPDPARVYHGGAELDDGRILVVGGCSRTVGRACVPEVDATLGSAYLIEPAGDGLRIEPNVPPLLQPRYGHHTLVSRDGIVFVVGGRRVVQTIDGTIVETGANSIELLLPGLASWAPYGPSLLEITSPIVPAEEGLPVIPRDVVSATLLDGGQIVIGLADGSIYAVDELHIWPLRNWCGAAPNCFDEINPDPTVAISERPRSLFALPGERILADNYLLPVSQLLLDGSEALNLALDDDAPEPPPGARAGALLRLLDDGTVIIGGGVAPASGNVRSPVMLRFRPQLDGPDEGEPVLEGLRPGSLILHDDPGDLDPQTPDGRIDVEAGGLILRLDPVVPRAAVGTWTHVRGFLSARFQLQATIETRDAAIPAFVFSFGAIARNTLLVGPDEIAFTTRDPNGEFGAPVDCAPADRGLDFSSGPQAVVIEVSPSAVELRSQGERIVRCPWRGSGPVAVGLGVASLTEGGEGVLRASRLALSRG